MPRVFLLFRRSPRCMKIYQLQDLLRDKAEFSSQLCQFWKHAVFLPDNGSEPCKTYISRSVDTNTLRLAGDKHLVARLLLPCNSPCCFLCLHLMPLFFFLSPALPKPHLVLWAFLTFFTASHRDHILYILHIMIPNKGSKCLKISPVWLLVAIFLNISPWLISLDYSVCSKYFLGKAVI